MLSDIRLTRRGYVVVVVLALIAFALMLLGLAEVATFLGADMASVVGA